MNCAECGAKGYSENGVTWIHDIYQGTGVSRMEETRTHHLFRMPDWTDETYAIKQAEKEDEWMSHLRWWKERVFEAETYGRVKFIWTDLNEPTMEDLEVWP